jgi:hypothetical protein
MPSIATQILSLILLIAYYRSKDELFWLTFVFILTANPAGFFSTADKSNILSLIDLQGLGSLYFWIPFTLLAYLKNFNKPFPNKIMLRNVFFISGFYLLILFLLYDVYKVIPLIRTLIPWFIIIVILKNIRSIDDITKFYRMIIVFIPIVLVGQLYKIVNGVELTTILGGISNIKFVTSSITETGSAARPIEGLNIVYLSLFTSTYLLKMKVKSIDRKYLIVFLFMSFVSVFLTATRSWLVGALIIIAVYFIVTDYRIKLIRVLQFAVLVIMLSFIVNRIPFLERQTDLAIDRYMTMEKLASGDLTAGGTLKRFDQRAPKVMRGFWEMPITGLGYGKMAYTYSDGHVGHHNLLMHTGIIGYSIFAIFWVFYIIIFIYKDIALFKGNPYKGVMTICSAFLLTLVMIHTTSQFFDYRLSIQNAMLFGFFLAFTNHASSASYEYAIKKEQINNGYSSSNSKD